MAAAIDRVERDIRRYGIDGSIRLAALLVARLISGLMYRHERHVWYRLDLGRERPRIALPTGLELVRAGADELPLLEQLPTIGLFEAQRRLASGASLWIVREGQKAAFSCWIFRDRMPVVAARDGWLEFPPGIVGLEDSVTSPNYRGRGLAPAAWSGVAYALMQEGVAAMITKVEEGNTPCRHAVEKIEFQAVASASLFRVLGRSHVEVWPHGEDSLAAFLVERLAH